MEIILGQAYSFCQVGQRDYQEDSRYPDSDQSQENQRFFLVCDGVGGCDKGEVASQTVCKAFASSLSDTNFSKEFTKKDFNRVLDAAYDALDEISDEENEGMATTMTFVCFHRGGCTMAHIGDSRIYQIRPDEGIIYRSDDHSLVNDLVRHGVITPDEAIDHPKQNVITRYMESVDADENRCMATLMQSSNIKAGDYFFLCSDGVLHCVTDDELVNIVTNNSISDKEKMNVIAMQSVESSDNNTAYLIPVIDVKGKEPEPAEEETLDDNNTKRLKSPQRGTEDVESRQKQSDNGFSRWLKQLFK